MSSILSQIIFEKPPRQQRRAWSLIVTFLGDAILPRGGAISASSCNEVMQGLELEPGTVRTAFSRMARDGHIQRERKGRSSFYRLTDEGEADWNGRREKLYRAAKRKAGLDEDRMVDGGGPTADNCGKAVGNGMAADGSEAATDERCDEGRGDDGSMNHSGLLTDAEGRIGLAVAPGGDVLPHLREYDGPSIRMPDGRLALFDPGYESIRKEMKQVDALVMTGKLEHVPEWVVRKAAPEEVAQDYYSLIERFESLCDRDPMEPIEAMCCRCLLIHDWRNILMVEQPVPSALRPDWWPEDRARAMVSATYEWLLDRSEVWLNESAIGPDGRLPNAADMLRQRFH